jgi:catechol 2,3-dioxygenase
MKSPWICALRSVSLTVPDLAAAEVFYTQTWGLQVAAKAVHQAVIDELKVLFK